MSANVKEMLFKQDRTGTSKKGNPYRIITLHDPETLENIEFFVEVDSPISTTGLKLKDKVKASFELGFQFGRPQMQLFGLTV